MDLEKIRKEIDAVDDKIAALYSERMSLVKKVADAKRETGAPTENTEREREILNRVTQNLPNELKLYAKQVFETLFSTSKAYQSHFCSSVSPIKTKISDALGRRDEFPVSASVACQGLPGAYSQKAAEKLFSIPSITYFRDWNAVFSAVEKGLCQYGVLPIENSTAGSVNAVYDLMRKHDFFIARCVKLRIAHFLLSRESLKPEEITEIVSHEQAINQCSEFLKTLKNVKITRCENTALAAKIVAERKEKGVACISGRDCTGIYGLKIIASEIQNADSNFTRFIAVSKQMKIFDGSDKISVMVNLPHETGSLNRLLNRFSTLGLNLTKLESRPIGSSPFEFAFYFDFDADIGKIEVLNLIAELENTCDRFVFLGGYKEIM